MRKRRIIAFLILSILIIAGYAAWYYFSTPALPHIEIIDKGEVLVGEHRERQRTIRLRLVNDTAEDFHYHALPGLSGPAPHIYNQGYSGWRLMSMKPSDAPKLYSQRLDKGAAVEFECTLYHPPDVPLPARLRPPSSTHIIGVSGSLGSPPTAAPPLQETQVPRSRLSKALSYIKFAIGLPSVASSPEGILPEDLIWSRQLTMEIENVKK